MLSEVYAKLQLWIAPPHPRPPSPLDADDPAPSLITVYYIDYESAFVLS
jgi:hypothetical protein